MEYTGRRVILTAREREDGWWRLAAWLDDQSPDAPHLGRYEEAWKARPLQFDTPSWTMLAIAQEMVRYLRDVAELVGQEQPDELDLWGDV